MDFSVQDIEMGVENDNNNRVIRKFSLNANEKNEYICVCINKIYRGSNEFIHKFKCAGIIKGNEAIAKGETNCAPSQLYGKSFFENSI